MSLHYGNEVGLTTTGSLSLAGQGATDQFSCRYTIAIGIKGVHMGRAVHKRPPWLEGKWKSGQLGRSDVWRVTKSLSMFLHCERAMENCRKARITPTKV